jgi:hypothetical protein
MITNATIQALLTSRSKTGTPLVDYTLVDLSDGLGPRIATWNVATLGAVPTQTELDAVTPAQVTAAVAAQKTAVFTGSSRQKDILATIALIKRAQGIAAWNALTVPQKTASALAEADVWITIRQFIEDNL